ncbi:hypothetical protein [Mangrovicoccus sp. HB161399]|uniref:hypothetical protein n=1 Tax=Mangrovicoccus sp. HB161399 TaxID=2720392 RepID=UPI001554426C|nr:hypothetical protein [Mangrovicoccus sp. HB161399]
MTLDKLIDLLAVAAVRRLAQEREAKDAGPGAVPPAYPVPRRISRWICVGGEQIANLRGLFTRADRRGRTE